jgi:hypothetical protein
MNMDQIITTDCVLSQLDADNKKLLQRLAASSPRFTAWFEPYMRKVKNKLRGHLRSLDDHAEDISDVLNELICAASLLDLPCIQSLLYEPFPRSLSGPDFKVLLIDSQELYVEAKRIRRLLAAETARDDFFKIFRSKLEAISMRYTLSFYCHDLEIDKLAEEEIYHRLILDSDQILCRVETELKSMETEKTEHANINLEHFAQHLSIDVARRPDSSKSPHCTCGFVYHCPTTRDEHIKFERVIFEKLGQLTNNACNVLYIRIDNDSHEYEGLEDAIFSINQELANHNEEHFQQEHYDISSFSAISRKLSGILIHKRSGELRLWQNANAACQVPFFFSDEIAKE